ncbi:polysaccharide pyruvyl transferase family protein [Oceanobacillus picturae]|uniref:polysaccharide pyruvyl transferase family protein n=1 Tax=Oceanobacillus picturae TaxID=171693 RepID=UPI000E67999D|nr:polysaccharide pyruvyl transferase family protein [Oceanobacillus picturae]RIU94907.1 polysaccharide pyruvyl transferase family protein [Oceanobacillus picturae]
MRNILMRARMSPLDTFDAPHILLNNSISGNVGNLVYQYGVSRTLMTEETNITPDYGKVDSNKADEINQNFDCYVIPLADAFRKDFVSELRQYTKLIKKLKIPVIVIGVGLRAPFEPKLNEGFPFDKDVKEFVTAVLERSSIIGVRGEITAKYLTKLGFREGIDHTVIGCPSMYTFGRDLKIRDTSITNESIITVNSSKLAPNNVLSFISRSMEQFPNHYFIPQWFSEMKLVYSGGPPLAKQKANYPGKMSDPVYMSNRVRFFLNVPTWLEFLKKADLSVGARLHGNITATIAGTPSLLIPKDARMRELAEYHNLTHIWYNEITDETNLMDLVGKVDFHSPEKKQAENFEHFIDFLNKNNLDHIYKHDLYSNKAPLDEKLAKVSHYPAIETISGCSVEEMVSRWEKYDYILASKNAKAQKDLKEKIAQRDKTIKKLKGNLNRKSVRIALKTANLLKFK